MADTTRLVLIRHGEANVYVESIVGGHDSCTGLSGLGRRQAAALRDRLASTGELGEVDALYASVMARAMETAEIIAPALGGLPVRTDCDLCEIHPGEAEGMSWADYEAQYGSSTWGPAQYHRPWAPGAETVAELVTRAGRRLWQLVTEHPGETVVVACQRRDHPGVVPGAGEPAAVGRVRDAGREHLADRVVASRGPPDAVVPGSVQRCCASRRPRCWRWR